MPDICIWNKCNNKCIMCTNPDEFLPNIGISKKEIFKQLNRLRLRSLSQEKQSDFLLTGGEPTINPNLFHILSYLRKNHPNSRILLLSNGRMFAYENFTKKILQFDNLDLALPIHGFNARSHDSITRTPGSFSDLISGLKNIKSYKKNHQIEIRIILTKATYRNLIKITRFIVKNIPWADRLVYIFMEIEGQAAKNIQTIGLKFSNIKIENLQRIITLARNNYNDVRLYHFPLCVIPRNLWKYAWRTLPKEEVTFLKKCGFCDYKKLCLGIHTNYIKLYGSAEFNPIKKKYNLILNRNNYHHPILK